MEGWGWGWGMGVWGHGHPPPPLSAPACRVESLSHTQANSMPGGGEMALVAVGNQNIILSGNASFTNFYKVFKRYTHFSQESISIPLEGPNVLMMDSGARLRVKVLPRNAALLKDLTLVFRIPDIYSKLLAGFGDVSSGTPAFRWIHMLGPLLIESVAIYVGGTKVQEFPGEWITVRATADLPADKYNQWRALVGDAPELHTPEWGIRGRSTAYPFAPGEYPHVVADPLGAATAPSVYGREIRVPLPFWFSESPGQALPLTALQLHPVEVQIQLRTMREVYRLMDVETGREPLRPGATLLVDPALPTAYDPAAVPNPYDNLTFQSDYGAQDDPRTYLRNFFTDAGYPIPNQDGFELNAHLEGTYVYLTEREEKVFVERELRSLVHQVQVFYFPGVTRRQRFDLEMYGLAHRLVFFGRRTDAIEQRNDYLNLSNWKNRGQAPYWPLSAGAAVPNSGLLVPFTQRDIVQSAKLILAGNDLMEEKPGTYFELHTPFLTGAGSSGGGLVRPDDILGPLYHYPFALNASDHTQPSGSLNTSRFRELQLEVQPYPLDPASPYGYDFTVYVETINVLRIMNGMAGLEFAI